MKAKARKLASSIGVSVLLFASSFALAENNIGCVGDRTAIPEHALVACFQTGLLGDRTNDDDQAYLRLLTPHWQGMDTDARMSALERYREGLSARAAVAVGVEPRTPPMIAIIHEQAIEIGRSEYVSNMIANAPEFTTGRGSGLSDEGKRARASHYYSDIISDFLTGNDNDSMKKFVEYAPYFAYYAVNFPDDFLLADRLQQEINIAESEARIAESEARIAELNAQTAELNARIAALDRLQRALQGHID